MKKSLLLLTALVLAVSASAQKFEKNILGVRAGMNVSSLTAKLDNISETSNSRIGFHVGLSDQILLNRHIPLYLETGLYVSSLGGKLDNEAFRPMYLQIPLMFNYHINILDIVKIQPSVGIYYGAGIGGKVKVDNVKADLFGDKGMFKRSDFGVRLGAAVVWRKYSFGLGYDIGCLNLISKDIADAAEDGETLYQNIKVRNGCFRITLGYNF